MGWLTLKAAEPAASILEIYLKALHHEALSLKKLLGTAHVDGIGDQKDTDTPAVTDGYGLLLGAFQYLALIMLASVT